jgi:hypothetical protein
MLAPIEWLRAEVPAVHAALRFHETGSGAAPALDGVRAVVFWLADPLRELYPACFAEASALEAHARERGLALVNPPSALSNSIKSVQARLWEAAGVPTAPCLPFADRAGFEAALGRAPYPLLLKGDLLHAQDCMHFCRSADEARRLPPASIGYPGVATAFVDTRAGWEAREPGGLYARYYHKKRLVVFGRELQPRHVFFSKSPIVGLGSSHLRRYLPRPGRPSRPGLFGLRKRERAMLAADYDYFRGPCEAPEVLARAARALGFGYAALDYSTRADGSVVLWEANPYPFVPGPGQYALPKERQFEERFAAFCRGLGGLFARLLDGAEG